MSWWSCSDLEETEDASASVVQRVKDYLELQRGRTADHG